MVGSGRIFKFGDDCTVRIEDSSLRRIMHGNVKDFVKLKQKFTFRRGLVGDTNCFGNYFIVMECLEAIKKACT